MKDLKQLPPPEKKVAAKILYSMGWSSLKLEQWLGISDNTVMRAVNEPTPEELKSFEEEFSLAIAQEKQKGLALGIKRLNELIPDEKRIPDLVKGLEFLEGKDRTPLVPVQINNFIKSERDEFGI